MIKFTNEVKDWNKNDLMNFLESTSSKYLEDYSGDKKEILNYMVNETKDITTHCIGVVLPYLINDKEYYSKYNNHCGYSMAIDLFDGLYGYYPTENDIEELDRLKGKVDTYVQNKSEYEYDIEEENNQLCNGTLNAIANHVEELVIGKVEKFVEDKLDKIVDVLGSKLENILSNLTTNQELQTE